MFAATVQYSTAIHTTRYHSSAATVAKAAADADAAAGVTGEKTDGRGKVSYPIFCSGAGDDEGTGGRGETAGFCADPQSRFVGETKTYFPGAKRKKREKLAYNAQFMFIVIAFVFQFRAFSVGGEFPPSPRGGAIEGRMGGGGREREREDGR